MSQDVRWELPVLHLDVMILRLVSLDPLLPTHLRRRYVYDHLSLPFSPVSPLFHFFFLKKN